MKWTIVDLLAELIAATFIAALAGTVFGLIAGEWWLVKVGTLTLALSVLAVKIIVALDVYDLSGPEETNEEQ